MSLDSTGNESNGNSSNPSLSADGRFIVFESEASNLVAGDTNGKNDVFVHDQQTKQTTRISVSSSGTQGDLNSSGFGLLTPDGRFVLFSSDATNLVNGDTNGALDVFVHDRQTGQTTRVSVSSNGTQGNSHSSTGALSDDGRYVSFTSFADNLVPGDRNGVFDAFMHDRKTGQTTRIVNSSGTQGNNHTIFSSISADGRFMPFLSQASNLVPGDTNGGPFGFNTDAFVHDRQTGQTTRVSVDSNGIQANGSSGGISISEDNRYVTFSSEASNLVTDDTNGGWDVFVHDRQTGETSRVSVPTNGKEANGDSQFDAPSRDARFIAFVSNATNLVDGDTNGVEDIFVHERVTSAKRNSSGTDFDLDGNGTSDLLWRNSKNGSTAIWLLNGANIGSAGFPGGVPLAWQVAGIGDVNGDGKADVIWRHTTSATVAIWLMNGTTITSVGFPASVPTAWSLQAVGDVNGDGKADLIWRNANDGNTAIWVMNGAKIAASGFLGKVPLAWQLAGAGDVDADGKADLIWRNGTSHAVAIWVMNGLTMTSSGFPGNASPDLQIAGVGDVNGDGKADLIWRNTNSGDVAVWLLNGTTMDSSGIVDRLPSQWQIAQVGDADGDGKADVIWYNTTTGAVVCWLLNGLTIGSEAFPGTVSTDWIIAGRPVPPPLSITTASTLPAGTVNKSYSITLAKSGGTPSFSWTVFSGSLPPGLTLNPSTGQISGTPTTAGNFLATIRVRDSGNPPQSAQELFSLTIHAPPSPPPTGGGGTLAIIGGPSNVAGEFKPGITITQKDIGIPNSNIASVSWADGARGDNPSLSIFFEYDSGVLHHPNGIHFFFLVGNSKQVIIWECSGTFLSPRYPSEPGDCAGVTVNRPGGSVIFSNTVLRDPITGAPPITLNGTLTFPSF